MQSQSPANRVAAAAMPAGWAAVASMPPSGTPFLDAARRLGAPAAAAAPPPRGDTPSERAERPSQDAATSRILPSTKVGASTGFFAGGERSYE